jgi:hypothetical protein
VRPAVLLALLAASTPLAPAQQRAPEPHGQEPPEILRRVRAAEERVRFSGVRRTEVLEEDGTRVVVELVVREGRRMRIVFPEAPDMRGQVIVESPRDRLHYNPATNEIRVLPPREMALFGMPERPMAEGGPRPPKLRFRARDGGEVAGVPTRLVEVIGPDDRPVRRLWIDPKTLVVLKAEAFGRRGEKLAGFEYRRINFQPTIPEGSFELNIPGARLVTPEDDLERVCRRLGLPMFRLPRASGFRLVSVRPLARGGVTAVMQSYGGPNQRVSLFVVKGDVDPRRLQQTGGQWANSHTWTARGVRLVLIGDMPVEELRRLAQQVTG